jgi:hypothetical protein
LLIVVAVAATVALVLPPDPIPSGAPTVAPTNQPPTDSPTDVSCSNINGSVFCRLDDYPDAGFHVDYSCPADFSTISDCSCAIVSDDNAD